MTDWQRARDEVARLTDARWKDEKATRDLVCGCLHAGEKAESDLSAAREALAKAEAALRRKTEEAADVEARRVKAEVVCQDAMDALQAERQRAEAAERRAEEAELTTAQRDSARKAMPEYQARAAEAESALARERQRAEELRHAVRDVPRSLRNLTAVATEWPTASANLRQHWQEEADLMAAGIEAALSGLGAPDAGRKGT